MIDMVKVRVIAGQTAEHLLGKWIAGAELGERMKSYPDAFLLRVKPEALASSLPISRIHPPGVTPMRIPRRAPFGLRPPRTAEEYP